MEFFIKLFVLLIAFDIIVVATSWYAAKTIKPLFPNWWHDFIVAEGYHEEM